MPSLGITARFIAALVGTVLFAWVAAIGFWTHDHLERRDAALNAHAHLVLQDLAAALEARLSLGLPLAQLPEVDRLLDTARLQLAGLRAVAVLDEQGRGLFSTDPVEIGERLLAKAEVQSAGGRQVDGEDEIFWLPVANDYGSVAGAALLRLSAGSSREGSIDFALSLIVRAAPVLGILGLVAMALGYGFARRLDRRAALATVALARLKQSPEEGAGSGEAMAGNLGLPLAAFAVAMAARHHRLAVAENELVRLDEMA
jgi:hypothetical protein